MPRHNPMKTDNILTKVVLSASNELAETRKRITQLGEVPFMMRERTRAERENYVGDMTPEDFRNIARTEGSESLQKVLRQHRTQRSKR